MRKTEARGAHDSVRTFRGGIPTIHDLVAPEGFVVSPSELQIGSSRYVRAYFVSQVPSQVFEPGVLLFEKSVALSRFFYGHCCD